MPSAIEPYEDKSTNLIYQLLFCDDLELYRQNTAAPYGYPFDILFASKSPFSALRKICEDDNVDARCKVLSYNLQRSNGHLPTKKILLAVIIELGLEDGLDVLAVFDNGTARYINQRGKILIWETTSDKTSNQLTQTLFAHSENIIGKIGPWDQPRRPHPAEGTVRITFLVSDGLYFGEGPIDVMFNDPMASPALMAATELLQYITEKAM